MKKKAISLLLVVALALSLCVPAFAEGGTLPDAEGTVITLTEDVELSDHSFESEVTINLNGHKLTGTATGTENVTIENKVEETYYEEDDKTQEHPQTRRVDTPACLLGVEGTFANDVTKYVADGFDVKDSGKTVFNNEDPNNFKVVVEVEAADTDYDVGNDFPDVYANENVTVTVKVTGARYASADFTLTWDTSLFVDATDSWDLPSGWQGDGEDPYGGYTSYRFTGAHEKVEDNPQEEYFKDGEIIGTFTMRALYIDETKVKAHDYATKATVIEASDRGSYDVFTVKSSGAETAKVIGSWRKAKEDSTTTPLATANLEDGVAHIILMDAMTGDVSAKTGLIYKAQGQNLLDTTYNNNTGFSALVGGVAPVGNDGQSSAKVATVVMTKAVYMAAAFETDGTTPKSFTPDYGTAGTSLTTNNIQATDAGDYVVCYKISAPGYASVTGVKNVNIAKQKVDLVWSAPATEEYGPSTETGINFEGPYNSSGFTAPTATYSDLNNGSQTATVNLSSGPNGTEQKAVGNYVFTAADNPNYEFNNPTVSVKVKGLTINDWTLKATNYENTGTGTDVTNGVIWRDGESRPIGYLDVADTASFAKGDGKYYTTENFTGDAYDETGEGHTYLKDATKYYTPAGVEVTNVHVTYEYSEGKYYKTEAELEDAPAGAKIGDEIWTTIATTDAKTVAELGKYKLRMTVTADNYEKMVQIVNFEIKNPIFVTEKLEYVAGYSIVLVYTNETGVSFKYGSGASAVKMYDVTDFGYKYNNNNYGNGSANYAHVYAIVVKGDADTSLVYASNEAAAVLTLPTGYTNTMPNGSGYKGNVNVNDVNNKGSAVVDLDDITAVQSVYNVNVGNMQDMEVVLRSDVNRDKMVDVNGDVAQVLAFYLDPTT